MVEIREKQLAFDTRLRLGLHSTEYLDITKVLNLLKITCVKRPLDSSISGVLFKTEKVTMILANSNKSLGHQHFTIAHEIYHYLTDHQLANRACRTEELDRALRIEQYADLFAMYFFLPEDAILNQLRLLDRIGKKLTLTDIIEMEQFFGVSRKVISWRLENLKLITGVESNQYGKDIIRNARQLGKNTELYKPTKERVIISDYAEKALEALNKGLISQSRYEEILEDAELLQYINNRPDESDPSD
jgi:Zn-dependent peptidase ImmA (M78 family)